MSLTPGTRLGVYEVISQIGAGGMGEVYRATDSRLKRSVAIKVLPASVAGDADRLARFQREAEVLAALNHPNIAAIYGLEKTPDFTALVMELVEGEDLSQRIARGAIPIDEALPIAKQIADALEAAHEQGIIHRDLKPANIKVRGDGTVKVLDFGLAKAMEPPASSSPSKSMSPTVMSPVQMSGVGVILGTAAYMSPEQAKGRPVDKRSDVWAFGCVLYEMLTGARAFAGDDVSDTLAGVLRAEPDWRTLPSETHASIRRLLRRCLEKDRKRRLSDAAGARLEIDDALTVPASDVVALPATASRAGWLRGAVIATAALVVGGAAAGGAVWTAVRPAPARVTRTVIQTSGATALTTNPRASGALAITPDGSRLVYTAASQLVVRRLDRFDAEALTGLGSPTQPFISPDGQWIGFFEGLVLKKVAIGGGPTVTVFKDNNPNSGPGGATWGTDGTIVYSGSIGAGLKRVAAAGGGEAEILTTPDRDRGEVRHSWPSFLPGGRALLFTISYAVRGPEIAVLNLETGVTTVLLSGLRARYLPSGHLVFGTENTLRAVAFDLERLTVAGEPVPVVSPVVAVQGQQGSGYEYDVAADGTLVYLPTIVTSPFLHTPVWVDRQGRETSLGMQARPYVHPRLSPDGTRVAVNLSGNIWIWDLVRSRLTRGPLDRSSVLVWMPDSARLIFGSTRGGGGANLYVQAADGTGTTTRLSDSPNMHNPTGLTADGAQIVFNEATPTQLGDISLLTMTPTPQVKPLVATRADERGGVVSPDGRWLAYESDRSGAYEVWVQPFPTVDAGGWQVSTAGGVQPLWARNGRELFYVAPDGALMAVQWRGSPESAGAPTRLIEGRYSRGVGGTTVRQYDVSADGQRFLMMKEEARETDVAPSINVVQNWFGELRRLVPTK